MYMFQIALSAEWMLLYCKTIHSHHNKCCILFRETDKSYIKAIIQHENVIIEHIKSFTYASKKKYFILVYNNIVVACEKNNKQPQQ